MGLRDHHELETGQARQLLTAVLECLVERFCLLWACLDRYSVVYRGDCLGGLHGQHCSTKVAVKVYEKPSLTAKKQKMATREAIVLKYLNSQG